MNGELKVGLFKELFANRKKIWELSINDFRNKFAGSSFGVIWAFIQPIVTVTIYWFIFDRGLQQRNSDEAPYILWLIAGMCPWFFFSDAMNSAVNGLIEYSYIVKKIVFKISILPLIKIISSGFVHAFFIVLVVVVYLFYGYTPILSYIQIPYYVLATFMLVAAMSYFTASIAVFFKDMTQIVSIILQYAMWGLPIMLDANQYPKFIAVTFRFNPMYYIIDGYRDCFIRKIWFWEKPELTMYFWVVVLILFAISTITFKRLKPHFADVL